MSTPRSRVERLVAAARRLSHPHDELGQEARLTLPSSTGLSSAGVALALEECLETHPTDAEIDALCASVSPAKVVHVLLSANVFVGAHRAIALALAASSSVVVRPSRREPETVRLLERAAGTLFEVTEELTPEPGDHVLAFGSDETLEAVSRRLPKGVTLIGHGSGLGAVVVDRARAAASSVHDVARAIARDVVPFDQRGCLSPRIVVVLGTKEDARTLGAALAEALAEAERVVPRGRLDPDEVAAAVRYRDTLRFTGEVLAAGSGFVGVDVDGGALLAPPAGRHLHVVHSSDVFRTLAPIRASLTTIGADGSADLEQNLAERFPGARLCSLGQMQRPRFDGPVDRRGWQARNPGGAPRL